MTRMMGALSVLCAVLMLSGCLEKEKGVGKYGMMDENTPEYTALRFAQSIYDDPDISVALTLSTDRMQRILQNYRTNRNVQRHVMNLKYDAVEIKPDGGNKVAALSLPKAQPLRCFLPVPITTIKSKICVHWSWSVKTVSGGLIK